VSNSDISSQPNLVTRLPILACEASLLLIFLSVKRERERGEEKEKMTKKTQGDATTRDPCEGSRGDDFSRVQKCARHLEIMPASLFRWMGRPVARNRKQRSAGPRKRRGKGKVSQRSRRERRTEEWRVSGKGEERSETRKRRREKGTLKRRACPI